MASLQNPKTRRFPKKFRFQLLQEWLTSKYQPVRVLDVGGGKGLLSYLLIQNGWQASVVDPVKEDIYLPKYKDLKTGKRVLLPQAEIDSVPRIKDIFKTEMAQDFDLLIGLHAHGSNLLIIEACQTYQKDFLLLPCCVIDEPIVKVPGVDWRESLIDSATKRGFDVKTDFLNFKGQNQLIYSDIDLVHSSV